MAESRLQLRWKRQDEDAVDSDTREWICFYELVLALDEHDIRREDAKGKKHDHLVVLLSETTRGSSREPCRNAAGDYVFDAPFRDGVHASRDAARLGGLSVVCIAPDGTVIPKSLVPVRQSNPETAA
jgi:hypothetical protein